MRLFEIIYLIEDKNIEGFKENLEKLFKQSPFRIKFDYDSVFDGDIELKRILKYIQCYFLKDNFATYLLNKSYRFELIDEFKEFKKKLNMNGETNERVIKKF